MAMNTYNNKYHPGNRYKFINVEQERQEKNLNLAQGFMETVQ